MAANKQITLKRHRLVRKEFEKLSAERKYKYEYIIKLIGEKFHYTPKTVEKIVCSKEQEEQPNLFS